MPAVCPNQKRKSKAIALLVCNFLQALKTFPARKIPPLVHSAEFPSPTIYHIRRCCTLRTAPPPLPSHVAPRTHPKQKYCKFVEFWNEAISCDVDAHAHPIPTFGVCSNPGCSAAPTCRESESWLSQVDTGSEDRRRNNGASNNVRHYFLSLDALAEGEGTAGRDGSAAGRDGSAARRDDSAARRSEERERKRTSKKTHGLGQDPW
mmetsp:Transcript_35115/g.63194  ORF Transcript_35115/g.63194 Transcript_35115/m.63194 type:complete len:206 (-) Transcript_35115:148-765(-)